MAEPHRRGHSDLSEPDVTVPMLQMTRLSLRDARRLRGSPARRKKVRVRAQPCLPPKALLSAVSSFMLVAPKMLRGLYPRRDPVPLVSTVSQSTWASEVQALRLEIRSKSPRTVSKRSALAWGTLSQPGFPYIHPHPTLPDRHRLTVTAQAGVTVVRHR